MAIPCSKAYAVSSLHALFSVRKIRIKRADRVVRTFTIAVFWRRAEG